MTRRARRRRNAALNNLAAVQAAQLIRINHATAATDPFHDCGFPTCTCTSTCNVYRSTTEDPHA